MTHVISLVYSINDKGLHVSIMYSVKLVIYFQIEFWVFVHFHVDND